MTSSEPPALPDLKTLLEAVTPQVYQNFKRAIALRKWPDGRTLTQAQLQTCLQAVIAYEHHHLPLDQHTGYVPPKGDACEHEDAPTERPLVWRE
jgi:uncharacterized protein YeaC (DUF1315 family)